MVTDKVKLFKEIRILLNDTDVLEFQDTELETALKSCIIELQKVLVTYNSPLLLKKITLSTNETLLDVDMLRIKSLYDKNNNQLYLTSNDILLDNEYKVFGNKLIINNPPATLVYYSKNDDIILSAFYDIIIDYIVSVCRSRIENNNNIEVEALNILIARVKPIIYSFSGLPRINRNNDKFSV